MHLSIVTDIATHTYLKQIRMRFVSGQGILELMKLKEKQQMGNGDCLPLSTHIRGKIMPFI